jgi:molybdenum cofactor biosynthesis protein B
MSYSEHKKQSIGLRVRCAIVTLSDTRTAATNASGQAIRKALEAGGHSVITAELAPNDPGEFERLLDRLLARPDIDAILTTGGTGISPRDQTIAVIDRRLDVRLDGFGELFRMLSWEQIGSGAMLSRATAGVAAGKLIFALPGSTAAVELAMSRLIVPELSHALDQLRQLAAALPVASPPTAATGPSAPSSGQS